MSEWNAALYDSKHDLVAEYGKGLLEFVPEDREQSILNLGCGPGTLTAQLTELARTVIGVDSSERMIERARAQYPGGRFLVCDALALPFEAQFDVAFSNAVFHWIADHDALLKHVRRALKPGGVLVCEFGAHGNIAAIETAFALVDRGYHPRFNFPADEQFAGQLTRNGFSIDRLYDYDRPTPLKDHERGLVTWMRQFFAADLEPLPEPERAEIMKRVESRTRPSLWDGSEWVADYCRLRAVAHLER